MVIVRSSRQPPLHPASHLSSPRPWSTAAPQKGSQPAGRERRRPPQKGEPAINHVSCSSRRLSHREITWHCSSGRTSQGFALFRESCAQFCFNVGISNSLRNLTSCQLTLFTENTRAYCRPGDNIQMAKNSAIQSYKINVVGPS